MASKQDPKKNKDNKNNPEADGTGEKEHGKEDNAQAENGGAGDVVADFIEDVWQVMTPEMLDRLRCVLIEDMGVSKKDADQFIYDQREIRKQRICLKNDKRIIRIGIRNQWIKEISRYIANQISSFLVGLLLANRTSRTKKIAEKILERLCDLTGEDTTVESAKTVIERSLVVIADRMATYFDEVITEIEQQMKELHGPAPSLEYSERESIATLLSTETYTPTEGDEDDLDQMSESELERLLAGEEKKKVSVQKKEPFSEEESEAKEISEEVESKEEESVEGEDEEKDDDEAEEEADEEEELSEAEDEEENEVEEEESNDEDEEDEDGEEEEDLEEEEEEESEVGEEEEGIEEGEEGEEGEELGGGDEPIKPSKEHLDIMDLLIEDIERTPKGYGKTDRQMAVKEIIEKRFKELAKDKLDKSIDSIVRFDIDETASVVANWLEKILPSGDIVAKQSLVPSLLEKQGSAFEIREGDDSHYQVHKLSSTTVAKKVADTKGVEFPTRKKKLPRSMSPLNSKSTKDWADWALEAANVGEEWGKWLDKAMENVEEHLLKDKDTDSSQEKGHDDWKNWKDTMEHEAQKWRAEKHKIKGEAYLWNKKIEGGKPAGAEKETKVTTY